VPEELAGSWMAGVHKSPWQSMAVKVVKVISLKVAMVLLLSYYLNA
jgi:hypothetical protein